MRNSGERKKKKLIKLISFDLWNTIIEDRKELEDKRGEIRIGKIYEYLSSLNIELEDIRKAYLRMSNWLFETQDKTKRSIGTEKQIKYILKRFGVRVNQIVFDEIKKAYESAIFFYPPPLVEGAKETLKKFYNLGIDMCIISDAGRTPGWALRKILEKYALNSYFKRMYFSDEIGWVKPNKKVFLKALKDFKVRKEEMVHIGDKIEKDIEGAKNAGINYIYFSRDGNCEVNPCGKTLPEIYDIFLKLFPVTRSLFS